MTTTKQKIRILMALSAIAIGFNACDAPTAGNGGVLVPVEQKFGNPVITDKYTADPAAMVYNDTVFLYVGHDQADPGFNFYDLREWLVYSSTDLKNWKEYPVPLSVKDFKWAKMHAWAAHVIEKDGLFFWYVTVFHDSIPGFSVGVAVSDRPEGPYKDALGHALITNDMTKAPFQIPAGEGKMKDMDWDDIDPAAFIDDDGQAYLFWGNTTCHYVKLKDNMLELDGEIDTIPVPNFTEAPWVHKRGEYYYLTYAYQFPEKTAYAMSKSVTGPYVFKGILNEVAGNSNTNHQAVIEYKGVPYFIYHNGVLQPNGHSFRRSVCIDRLYYNPDGTIKRIVMTTEGVGPVD